jgi:MoaA/NifB/PqqE/SkfB family radical SAM enzyme
LPANDSTLRPEYSWHNWGGERTATVLRELESTMKLSGLHLLLTYRCTFECDHCFVWGSPWQRGTMTLHEVRRVLESAKELGGVQWIYFEGGESFLYYTVLLRGVEQAAAMGFKVGIVTNGYWATDADDAREWLKPLKGLVQDLSISSDAYHGGENDERHAENARSAAEGLDIPVEMIRVAQPESTSGASSVGQIQAGEVAVRYRGRAADKLAGKAVCQPWTQFTECPFEELRAPDRVHVDPAGNLHICQGISAGNLFRTPLSTICETYDPDSNPILGPLLEGGPAELVRCHGLPHSDGYADACHLCYEARCALRTRFPDVLTPDQMYGVADG